MPQKEPRIGLAKVQTENEENALKSWAGTGMGRVKADAAPGYILLRTRYHFSSR